MTKATKFMTANEIIKEHRHRVETLEAERKICGISSYRQRLEDYSLFSICLRFLAFFDVTTL